jgi:iturin family lipopeptide synthetase B
MLSKNNIKNIYPLSPLQEGMYFHWQLDPRSASYHEQVSYRLEGELDIPRVKQALGMLMERYDILRTVFAQKGTKPPLQVALKQRDIDFDFRDLSKDSEAEETVRRFKREDRLHTFDLKKDVLMRVCLFRTAASAYEFIWSYHHILMDGWCVGILVADFLELYRSLGVGTAPRLKPVKHYLAYIDWLQKRDRAGSLDFWRGVLEGYDEAVGIPLPQTGAPKSDGYSDNAVLVEVEEELTSQLLSVASELQVTVNTMLQSLWGVLLGKYTRKEDVVFGAVVSGRPPQIEGVESMVGLFINTVPVRVRFDGDTPLSRLFVAVQAEALDSEPHHYTSLADIQAQSLLKHELIDHIFVFENFPLADLIDGALKNGKAGAPAIQLRDTEVFERSNYQFSVNAALVKNRLHIRLKFNGNRFEADSVHAMKDHLLALVRQAAEGPDTAVRDLDILSATQREALVAGFNNTRHPFEEGKTIPELFEEVVAETPDADAVVYGEQKLTYRELDRQANGVAHQLIEAGIAPGDAVALVLERSVEMAVAVMGVLKAGAAYVPVDPNYPDLRKEYILEDCGAKAVIGNQWEFIARDNAPDVAIDSSLPAYMIYTSGTTGRPKGTIVEHRNLHHLLVGLKLRIYDAYPAGLKVALLAPYVFDASVKQIFAALLLGHTLYIVPEEVRVNGEELIRYYRQHSIDISDGTPTHLRLMTESNDGTGPELPVRHFIIGGDALSRPVVERFFAGQTDNPPAISNIYGVAECAVDTTCFRVERDRVPQTPVIPIGTPLANSRVYILDLYSHPQPFGIPGEICIAGAGVGGGYLNREELNREKFLEDPFVPGEKMYRSGDMGLRTADGSIRFIGRIDRQVKIRGFRIETGEIEANLRELAEIDEAVVTVRTDEASGQTALCAYYTAGGELENESIRRHLAGYLPPYMIPASFTRLESIPVTSHGKVDTRALPDPQFSTVTTGAAPSGPLEKALVDIWAAVLGIPAGSIGVDDDFFDLGGHSLRATILASHIHKELEVKLPLAQVFANPTVRRLAAVVKGLAPQRFVTIPRVDKKEYYPLSSAQHRLYFMQRMDPTNNSYNMKNIFVIEGDLDPQRLQEACRGLIQRHHSLRTAFVINGKSPVQRVLDDCPFEVDRFTGTDDEVKGIVEGYVGPFDLASPPLLRVGLVELEARRFVLMVVIHHIVSDGVSNDILIKDFWKFYHREELPPLRIQYTDYAAWQETAEAKEILERQEEFWLEEFAGPLPVLTLPLDFDRPAKRSFDGASLRFPVEATLAAALLDMARQEGVTLYMLMLAIFNVLLSKWTGANDIVVGTGVAGRPHADTQGIIGMFVNVLPVRNAPAGDKSFRSFLHEVKHKTLRVFENQDYPFDRLVEKVGGHTDLSRNPIYDVVLQVQNTASEPAKTGGSIGAELRLSAFGFENDSATFDLLFEVREAGEGLEARIEYCTRLFTADTMKKVFGYFERIAAIVTADPEAVIRKIELVAAEEKRQILAKLDVSDEPMAIDFNF